MHKQAPKPAFRSTGDWDYKLAIPGFKTKAHGSAWVAHNGEDTITITLMDRQDSRTSWGVMYTKIDGAVRFAGGLTGPSTDAALAVAAINRALAKMTANWIEPLPAK